MKMKKVLATSIATLLTTAAISSAYAATTQDSTNISIAATVLSHTSIDISPTTFSFADVTNDKIAAGDYALDSTGDISNTLKVSTNDSAITSITLEIIPGDARAAIDATSGATISTSGGQTMQVAFKANSCGAAAQSTLFTPSAGLLTASTPFNDTTNITSAACDSNPGSFLVGIPAGQNPVGPGSYSGTFTVEAVGA